MTFTEFIRRGKLTFKINAFTIKSGTVLLAETFELINSTMSGQELHRSGAYNEGLQPDNFSGSVEISDGKATFTNFTGNWRLCFQLGTENSKIDEICRLEVHDYCRFKDV